MNSKFKIKNCPNCGSNKIQQVTSDIIRTYKGHSYKVPNLTFYHCSNCDEKIYDSEAMQKIEAYSPAYRKARALVDD